MKERYERGGLAAILNESPLILTIIAAGLLFLLITGLRGCSKSEPKTPAEPGAPVVTTPAPVQTTAQSDDRGSRHRRPDHRSARLSHRLHDRG